MRQKVVVVGQGYVGLPVSMRAAEAGFEVVGFDVDARKIDALSQGRSYIDDVTDVQLTRALASGRFIPSDRPEAIAGFDVAVITVPTPLRDGAPDMSHIKSASELVGGFVQPDSVVILESTTYPGTTETFVAPILEERSGLTAGVDFRLGFSPERIDPGNTIWTFEKTPKLVSGIDRDSLQSVQEFYDRLVEHTVPTVGTREAEMAKLLENTFRHVNIALVNELARYANDLRIDIWDVIRAASTKPFGFMPFFPGPGVGGHCLPIDPTYLSWQFERELGAVSRFVEIANDINGSMPRYVVSRIQDGLNRHRKSVNGSRVLVIGIAYKSNSGDARETPATGVIKGLLDLGADVAAHDNRVAGYELDRVIERVQLTPVEITKADAVVLLTNHADVDLTRIVDHASWVLDTRNVLPAGAAVEPL